MEPKGRDLWMAVVGVYLAFTGAALVRSALKAEPNHKMLFVALGVCFAVLGLAAAVIYVGGVLKGWRRETEPEEDEEESGAAVSLEPVRPVVSSRSESRSSRERAEKAVAQDGAEKTVSQEGSEKPASQGSQEKPSAWGRAETPPDPGSARQEEASRIKVTVRKKSSSQRPQKGSAGPKKLLDPPAGLSGTTGRIEIHLGSAEPDDEDA